MNSSDVAHSFRKYFSIDLAITPEQLKKVSRIRYNVYCKELAHESPDNFPDGLEFDHFDSRSLHCLITHKKSNQAAGCVRLVKTFSEMDEEPLPLEQFCYEALHLKSADILGKDRSQVCEISRLAVDCAFRRRAGEQRSQVGGWNSLDVSDSERRTFSLIAEAGFLAAIAMAKLRGREYMFAMMEPALPKVLRRSGIFFEPAGDLYYYHGLRAPYQCTVSSAEKNLRPNLRELYYYIYDRFDHYYYQKQNSA